MIEQIEVEPEVILTQCYSVTLRLNTHISSLLLSEPRASQSININKKTMPVQTNKYFLWSAEKRVGS